MPYLYQTVLALVLVIVQVLSSSAVSISGAQPDLVLIYLIWVIIERGQMAGELWGFGLGLVLDVLSGGILGSQALSKATVGFLLGYFYNEEKTKQRLRNWPFLIFVATGAVINNIIYYVLFTQASTGFIEYLTEHGGLSALYTTILAIAPMIYFSRRPLYT